MKYTKEQYAKVLYEIFSEANPSETKNAAKKFIALLRKNGDWKRAREIVERFSTYADEREGRQRIEVTSARALGESEKKHLAKIIGEALRKKIDMEERIDPLVLGGVKVKAGDEIFDFTLRRRLRSFVLKK